MRNHFERGLLLSAGLGCAAYGMIYVLLVHTPDIRARYAFLLAQPDTGLTAVLVLAPLALGLGTLAIMGGLTRAAVTGAAVGALAAGLMVSSGVLAFVIPATGYDDPPRYAVAALLVGGAVTLLWRARRAPAPTGAKQASRRRTA
jgi:hypothetical protein